jgi:hypothetical protein
MVAAPLEKVTPVVKKDFEDSVNSILHFACKGVNDGIQKGKPTKED